MNNIETSIHTEGRVYLCAPVNALVEGIYEENIPLYDIKRHGNFGLGTFNDLDGEMVMLDGRVYQIDSDGRVSAIADDQMTPFACVTTFRPSIFAHIEGEMEYSAFLQWLSRLLPSPNLFYAIRIEGQFAYLKARSVPKQVCYRPLVDVAKEQHVFQFHAAEGTLAGFFTPDFVAAVNVPGLHLHFLSYDLQEGGHLLECRPQSIRVAIQPISTLELSLPMSREYLEWDFHRDIGQDLNQAEK